MILMWTDAIIILQSSLISRRRGLCNSIFQIKNHTLQKPRLNKRTNLVNDASMPGNANPVAVSRFYGVTVS